MTKRCPIEYQIAIYSNIYLSKLSRSVILNWASLLHWLHTSERTSLKNYSKRDLLNVKMREKPINSAKVHMDNAYIHGFHSNRYYSSS